MKKCMGFKVNNTEKSLTNNNQKLYSFNKSIIADWFSCPNKCVISLTYFER